MALYNTGYPREVLQDEFNIQLNTRLNTRPLYTVDETLTAEAGTIQKIIRYTYTGGFQKLAEGAGNTIRGKVNHTTHPYEVAVSQQVFDYTDEEFYADPKVVEAGLKGMAATAVNAMNADVFAEWAKATLKVETAISYEAIVDAIALMDLEDESGLFLIINPADKAVVRKDPEFVSARAGEIVFSGQIGSIAGVPVIVSKLADKAVLAHPSAVKVFVKKESEIEDARDAEKRINTVIGRKVNLVALVDDTKVVLIGAAI